MSFLSDVGPALLSGGATGLLGTLFGGVAGFFKSREERKAQREEREYKIALANTQAEAMRFSESIKADAEARAASYKEAVAVWSKHSDNKLLVFVDFIRGLTRPVLTLVSTGTLILIVVWSFGGLLETADVTLRGTIALECIRTALYLITTCVTWWFGGRAMSTYTEKTGGFSGRV